MSWQKKVTCLLSYDQSGSAPYLEEKVVLQGLGKGHSIFFREVLVGQRLLLLPVMKKETKTYMVPQMRMSL
jgi:hypothetical protein